MKAPKTKRKPRTVVILIHKVRGTCPVHGKPNFLVQLPDKQAAIGCPDCKNWSIKKQNKYNAKKKTIDGRTFDSTAEANYYTKLKGKRHAKQIDELSCQFPVQLTKYIVFKVDFRYYCFDRKRWIYADVKGHPDKHWSLITKLWQEFGPGSLEVIKDGGAARGFYVDKTIVPDTR